MIRLTNATLTDPAWSAAMPLRRAAVIAVIAVVRLTEVHPDGAGRHPASSRERHDHANRGCKLV